MPKKTVWRMNGFIGLAVIFTIFIAAVVLFVNAIQRGTSESPEVTFLVSAFLTFIAGGIISSGILVVAPNESFVVLFFGKLAGTLDEAGFWLTVPLSNRQRVSLRVTNFNTKQLKVNDANGNPIEIAAVVVFRVADSAKAKLDVENYMRFVETQSETALRHVAGAYPYEDFDGNGISLRANGELIAEQLTGELKSRLTDIAGVEVLEARLTHLAYSAEVASMMLQRQQAAAIVAARQTIVEGAVGMVKMALAKLEADQIVKLNEDRKATMVNNLMVAIVSERAAQPVVNTGSIDE